MGEGSPFKREARAARGKRTVRHGAPRYRRARPSHNFASFLEAKSEAERAIASKRLRNFAGVIILCRLLSRWQTPVRTARLRSFAEWNPGSIRIPLGEGPHLSRRGKWTPTAYSQVIFRARCP